eukprot:CAMPEP_0198492806 /NCGR_PEP_ID=MMETSP1462-20131121/3624_1 /TAXON_ID=1333877 /ORGANISM="Brandtodinium nutriculum, Strain RCC3387" /LENGTH=113 /DNA_ID=CAMNT_0044221455 /DNA_START=144 /DNA_END=482 /DNA_ORIENTATION=+
MALEWRSTCKDMEHLQPRDCRMDTSVGSLAPWELQTADRGICTTGPTTTAVNTSENTSTTSCTESPGEVLMTRFELRGRIVLSHSDASCFTAHDAERQHNRSLNGADRLANAR